ncbi:rhodanese-like domain-containing protein [Flammeovirga agarivorans]|uniref:Rhodanese-like domain-containing protein n=1 Tax=Flammeovirga agarivorans TaxID=2726742 RepID=A0A7X8SPT3_9BACT|nr:rhodanese-like domain-containing protein [Flammeovirga agarivorans]NLR94153.1 rhodanese-like domain-containing protein [Flammeovirga agarivorans]
MNYRELVNNGTPLLDVRSDAEFNEGHIEGAVNIPVNDVQRRMDEVKKLGSPLIVCCLSGGRAGVAKALIEAAGVKEVYNAGGWESLL